MIPPSGIKFVPTFLYILEPSNTTTPPFAVLVFPHVCLQFYSKKSNKEESIQLLQRCQINKEILAFIIINSATDQLKAVVSVPSSVVLNQNVSVSIGDIATYQQNWKLFLLEMSALSNISNNPIYQESTYK